MAIITISAPAATVNTTTATNATAMATTGADTITSSIANLTGSTIDADAGTDKLTIIGGGTFAFGAATITNIEEIQLSDDAVYNLTFNDANIGAAQSLKIVATAVGASNGLVINASAETNGTIELSSGAGADSILGGTGSDTLSGGDGNDSISGGGGADSLSGGAGNDTLRGQAGNDTLDGGAGTADQVSYTGAAAAANINLLTGTATDGDGGTDAISNVENALGSNNNDTLIGSNGDNVLVGAGGADLMSGADGNDILSGGAGADTLSGGAGLDRADYAGAAGAVNVNLNGGTASDGDGGTDTLVDIERAAGSANNDTLIGDANANLLRGNAGSDTLSGAGGNDMADYFNSTAAVNVNLATGAASDGFGGTDTFVSIEQAQGSAFNDSLTGSAGDNFFTGLAGNDTINGNNGGTQTFFDVVDYLQATSAVTVNLGTGTASDGQSGTDTLVDVNAVRGSTFGDALTGGSTLFVSGVAIESFDGRAGNDTLNGGDGNDRADYFTDPAAVTVNLGTGTASDGYGGTDSLLNMEMARGSAFADLLIGSNLAQLEFFDGRGGNDTISGGAGNDQAMYQSATSAVNVNLATGTATDGEGGTDVLNSIERVRGSDFNDTLTGSGAAWESFEGMAGNDTISGGGGVDRYDVLNFTTAAASINLTTGTATDGLGGTDQLDSIENVRATNFNDTVVGSAAANGVSAGAGNDEVTGLVGDDSLMGDNGNDVLDGGADNDQLFGDAGDDTVIGGLGSDALMGDGTGEVGNDQLSGDAGNDSIFGGDGNDLMVGGIGEDQLVGGNGNDTLSGGAGADVYFGETGADRLVVGVADGNDTIVGFEPGVDKIDLTAHGFGTFDNFLATRTFDMTNDNGYIVTFAGGHTLTVIGTLSVFAGDYLI